ncbi:hypothetical protein HA402_012339 [Bradysia odoriphaga]|nr:hypothetical protein HA402_012339 [Bradysia odoriphaga]
MSSETLFPENFSELDVVANAQLTVPEHWDKYPNMEIIETKFGLDIGIDPGENQNWLYNLKMNKVFIKLNSVMTVTVSYKPYDAANLSLRAMIVYTSPDDMHLQVKRCANHKAATMFSIDHQDVPVDHILKCYHPHAKYHGSENAQLFGDRLSIVVPLDRPVVNESGIANETIKWEFLCQNSCATGINRKSTAVIFTLENEAFEIIGKKVMPFKVCSCPKRDMQREDTSIILRKRESKEIPHGKRPSKVVCSAEIKVEPPTPSPVKNYEPPFPDTQTSHTVTLTMPNKESMKHVLRCAFNEVTGAMARGSNNYEVYADKIQGLLNSL